MPRVIQRGHRSSRATRRWVAGVLATVSMSSVANADTNDYWNQPAGGSWDNPANWSAGVLPGNGGGNATFNLASASPYTVGFDATSTDEEAGNLNLLGTDVIFDANLSTTIRVVDFSLTAGAGQNAEMTFNGQGTPIPDALDHTSSQISLVSYDYVPFNVGPQSTLNLNSVYVRNEMEFGSGAGFNFASGSIVNATNSILGGYQFRTIVSASGTINCNDSDLIISGMTVEGNSSTPAMLNLLDGSKLEGLQDYPQLTIGASNASGTVNINGSTASVGPISISGLNGNAQLNMSNGAVLLCEGDLSVGSGTLNLIGGNCNIFGRLLIGNQGTLMLENYTGSYYGFYGYLVESNMNLSSGSTFDYVINNRNPGTINLTGDPVYLNGALNVSFANGFDPTAGESFQPFSNFNKESGVFSAVNLPPLDPGLGWDISQLYKTGTISVIAVPEPAIGLSLLIALPLLLRRRAGVAILNRGLN